MEGEGFFFTTVDDALAFFINNIQYILSVHTS